MHNRLLLFIEIAAFVIIVYMDAIGLVPVSQTIFLIPLIWMVLKLRRERFSSLGFTLKDVDLGRSIFYGIIIGVGLEVLATYVTTPFISDFFGIEPDLSELAMIEGNIVMLGLFLCLSWLLGAFGEEICFRGFLMNRVAGILGNNDFAWIIALVLSSILFGYGHTEQGISGWVQEGLSGLFLGIVFLLFNKNLSVPIIAHGVSNTVALSLIYLGHYPGV